MTDILSMLGAIAPTIASALGGPAAGLGVKALENVFGLPAGDKEVALQAIAAATPDQLLALKKADGDFAVQMKNLDIDLEKISAADRDSARRREIDSHDSTTPRLLAMLLTVGFFGLLGFLLWREPPQGSATVLNVMLGSLGTGFATMLAYYFGSSSGSVRKDQMLAASQPPAK